MDETVATNPAHSPRQKLETLIAHAKEQQARQGKEDAFVVLTTPGAWGKRTYARLFGQRGPMGMILADNVGSEPPSVSVQFQSDEVIRACERALADLGDTTE